MRAEQPPDHKQFIDSLRQKYSEPKITRTQYLWQIIYRRRLLLLGVIGIIVLITFNPLKWLLNRKDFRSELEENLKNGNYGQVLVSSDELYRDKKIDRQEYYYYFRLGIEGTFDALYGRAEAAYGDRDYTEAVKGYREFIDFVYENKAHLGISSAIFGAFQREIYDQIKFIPADTMAVKKLDDLKAEYEELLSQIVYEGEVRERMKLFLDAVLKLKKIESTQFL